MALVLTVQLKKSFFVDHTQYVLSSIVSEDKVKLTRVVDQAVFEVTITEKVEVEEDVIVYLGDRMTTKETRIAIEAPRSKIIASEENYFLRYPEKLGVR